ncbi:MAG: hypothetical protein WA747_06915 [Steroidobacteraceae bacterium]
MATSLYPPQRPLSIGEIIDAAFRIYRATVAKCLTYALIAVIAGQLPNIYYLLSGRGLAQSILASSRDAVWDVLYVVGSCIGVVLWSAILLRQHAVATGRAAAAGEELGRALTCLVPMVLLGILTMVAVGWWFLIGFLFSQPMRVVIWVIMTIPASFVMVALSVAWVSLLLADRGPVAALSHSWRLTSGSLWRLTGVYTVGLVIVFAIYLVFGLITGLVSVLLARNDLAVITAVAETLIVIMSAVVTPFYTALVLAVFGDLVARKEGTDLAQRISAAAAG